jgi:hypothetical protein
MSVAKLRTLSGALFKAPPGFLSQRILIHKLQFFVPNLTMFARQRRCIYFWSRVTKRVFWMMI